MSGFCWAISILPLNDEQFILLGTERRLGGTPTSIGEAGDIAFTSSGLIYKRITAVPASD